MEILLTLKKGGGIYLGKNLFNVIISKFKFMKTHPIEANTF